MTATPVCGDGAAAPWGTVEFTERLRAVAEERYHDRHPFNLRMHQGELTPAELRRWIANRFHYQRHIPVKDALILAKFDEPALRRVWLRRIQDHDGTAAGEGGIERWLRLGEAAGLDRSVLWDTSRVLPGVRLAVEGYVNFCRLRPALDAVAASLTELSAPGLMRRRIAAFERHYPWIEPEGLAYFRSRVGQGGRDSEEALALVRTWARTREQQERAVTALTFKCEVLWALLDAIDRPGGPAPTSPPTHHPPNAVPGGASRGDRGVVPGGTSRGGPGAVPGGASRGSRSFVPGGTSPGGPDAVPRGALPGVLDMAGTSGAMSAPGTSHVPGASHVPGRSDAPCTLDALDAAGTSGAPGASGASRMPGALGAPDTPNVMGAPDVIGASRTPDASGVLDMPRVPGVPDASRTPGPPDALGAAGAPYAAGAPDAPDAPRTPDVPGRVCADASVRGTDRPPGGAGPVASADAGGRP